MTRMWILILLHMLMFPLATPCQPTGEFLSTRYNNPGELQLSRGNSRATIPNFGKEWEISFLFKPTAFTYNDNQWTGIFAMQEGRRYSPGIFYRPASGLIVKSEIDGKTKQNNMKPAPAPLGQWTSISVSQKKTSIGYIYTVNIGGELKVLRINKKPTEFENIEVFASSPDKPARPGSIKDITITSNGLGTCKCGIKKTSGTRIVGGDVAGVNEYPWIAIFAAADGTISPNRYCASTLIAKNWALTAAHCVLNEDGTPKNDRTPTTMSVVLGVHDRTVTTNTLRKVVPVAEIIAHPAFGAANTDIDGDIALLRLGESVDLDIYTPACLPAQGADFSGKNGWVYGWGRTGYRPLLPNAEKLQELEVPIVSDATCRAAMEPLDYTISADMLCAGGVGGEDACVNDSGGPLTVDVDGKHTLVGDVSFGHNCAEAGLYGVYAETAYFRTWIDQTIAAKGGATFCT